MSVIRSQVALHHWLDVAILVAIVGGYLLVGGLYATQTPPWQAPDEPAHVNYILQLETDGCCPVIEMGDWDSDYLSQLTSKRFAPELTGRIADVQYEDHQPPLYYLTASALLNPGPNGDGLTALRLLSVVMGAGIVVCAYFIAKVMFPQRPGTALGTAALVAFVPQNAAILGSVNNDALANLLVAVTLLVATYYLSAGRKAARWRWHLAFGVLVGLAFVTKATAYFLVFIALAAIAARPVVMAAQGMVGQTAGKAMGAYNAISKLQIPGLPSAPTAPKLPQKRTVSRIALRVFGKPLRRSGRSLLIGWGTMLAIALSIGALWWVRNSVVYGFPDVLGLTAHDVVVVGQLRTAKQIEQVGGFGPYLSGAIQTTFNSFWGQFGWMALPLPVWAYRQIGLLLVGAFAGVVYDVYYTGWIAKQQPTARQLAIGALLGLTAFFSAAAYIYYNLSFYQVQGRYLFTALIPFALLVAAGLDAWSRGLGRRLPRYGGFATYLTPLVLAGSLGAFNLWLIRFVLPFLAP
jgi:hypothetical protein